MDPVTVGVDSTVEAAEQLLAAYRISGLPVVDGAGQLVGVFEPDGPAARWRAGPDPAGARTGVGAAGRLAHLLAGADRVIRMESGRVAFAGTASDFLATRTTTVWVAPGDEPTDGELASIPFVERVGWTGRWVALKCRERDVATVLRSLADGGVVAGRIRTLPG